jgi:hypothetical protein
VNSGGTETTRPYPCGGQGTPTRSQPLPQPAPTPALLRHPKACCRPAPGDAEPYRDYRQLRGCARVTCRARPPGPERPTAGLRTTYGRQLTASAEKPGPRPEPAPHSRPGPGPGLGRRARSSSNTAAMLPGAAPAQSGLLGAHARAVDALGKARLPLTHAHLCTQTHARSWLPCLFRVSFSIPG